MLTWISHHTESNTVHAVSVAETSENAVCQIIEASAEKAIQILKENIQDNSLYLLFEWDANQAKLNIVVTDASKKLDSPQSVCCTFSSLAVELARESEEQRLGYTESVKFWLHDYLTTCTAFFNYSLVAIFHSSSRDNTELL
ncbi:hypothetical protein GCM10011613_16490 [Cellvibrio zantedeschiae]|uniref:Uncharacterized protein n=1 Tax=Cellvibrio zantedeschiae TaxID=1237077 RepID=A0ABQ3B2Q7_9GAMM|nr:hypothetical protein [Cellvibrio zantedeschiae]GGY72236.1 hypothetical protein GCM10011613_16490 [Cellvibrio zantedeschiae]